VERLIFKNGNDDGSDLMTISNMCMAKVFPAVLLVAVIFFSGQSIMAQEDSSEIVIDGTIHYPEELYRILENSDDIYILEAVEESVMVMPRNDSEVIREIYYIDSSGGAPVLRLFEISDSASEMLHWSEVMFSDGDYAGALAGYQEIPPLEPDYHLIWTFIGDAHYNLGNYDSAVYYLDRAVEENFIDYDAHWFLADALFRQGKFDEAAKEITYAHILNVHHEVIFGLMKPYWKRAGHLWQDWDFRPAYEISEESDTVYIRAPEHWIAYAMVKALWKYEPDYAERMGVRNHNDSGVYIIEETEALLCHYVSSETGSILGQIIADGYLNEFIKYEMALKKIPKIGMLFSRDEFERLFEYIKNYHLATE